MALAPSLEEQTRLAETLRQRKRPLERSELAAAGLLAAVFGWGAAAAWALYPPHGFRLLPALLCVGVLALAVRAPIDTPFGFTAPTQLAFVPLVFAVPVALVPIAVLAAMTLAMLSEVVQDRTPVTRLLKGPANSLYCLGPVLVLAAAHEAPEHASALLLAGALVAQFGGDFAASALLFRIGRGAPLASQLRETWVYAIDLALSGVGLVVAERVGSAPADVLVVVPLLGLFAVFSHERSARLQSLLELNNAYRGTALVLGDVVEADDGYTGEHSKGVVALALKIADSLHLDPARRRNLEFAALLHDVGKIAVPKEIVNKPGELDPEEWTVIKAHTVEGERMLARVGGFMREVGLIVRSHHERWDGGGYPDGLAGEEIPLEARIIACCDTWNAMRTDRVYRKALSRDAAVAELKAGIGTQFDPRVARALTEIVAPGEILDADLLPAGRRSARAAAPSHAAVQLGS
jgi:putative nucleotidyltransferase with HDIG domain